MKKQLAILLAALFLLVGIGLSFHHHEDGHVHNDCPVCVVATHHQSVENAIASSAPIITLLFFIFVFASPYIPINFQTLKKVRAPPFLSHP